MNSSKEQLEILRKNSYLANVNEIGSRERLSEAYSAYEKCTELAGKIVSEFIEAGEEHKLLQLDEPLSAMRFIASALLNHDGISEEVKVFSKNVINAYSRGTSSGESIMWNTVD